MAKQHATTLRFEAYSVGSWQMPIGMHLKSVIESSHRQFVVARYGIWCNLHNLLKMTCFKLTNFIKPNFVSESCCHV